MLQVLETCGCHSEALALETLRVRRQNIDAVAARTLVPHGKDMLLNTARR